MLWKHPGLTLKMDDPYLDARIS